MSSHRAALTLRGLITLLLTYAVLQTAALATFAAPSPRADTDPGSGVQVSLEAVEPVIAGPETEIQLSGTLRNLGSTPAPVHSIRVSTAYRGLDTRGAVQEWAQVGVLQTPIVLAEDHIGVALAPGATVRWFVSAPPGTIDPGFDFATLPVRIEVLATDPSADAGIPGEPSPEGVLQPGADTGLGAQQESDLSEPETDAGPGAALPGSEVRSFLPWQAIEASEFNPVQLAWLAPLTLPGGPDLVTPDDQQREAAWQEAIGADSAARELLDGLAGTDATFVVDPALLQPLDPVASLTEAIVLPGEEEPTEPTPTQPEPTAQPSQPAPTAPEATSPPPTGPTGPTPDDPEATGGAATDPAPGPGSAATEAPPGEGTDQTAQPGQADAPVPEDPGVTEGAEPTEDPGEEQPTDGSEPTTGPDPDLPPTPPTTDHAVTELVERLQQLPQDRLWWLPVGDTDTAALLQAQTPVADIAELVGRPPIDELPAPGRTDLAWPVTQGYNDTLIESLDQVWTAAGGATGRAGPGQGSLTGVVVPVSVMEDVALTSSAVRPHTSGTPLLGYDERLSGIVASAAEDGQGGRAVQRFLAETLATYQEGPATDRSLLVAIPRGVEVSAETLQALTSAAERAPWLQSRTASELLATGSEHPPTTVSPAQSVAPQPAETGTDSGQGPTDAPSPGNLSAYSQPAQSPLTESRVARTELTRQKLVGATEIVPGAAEPRDTWWHVLDLQYSTSWRGASGWDEPVEQAAELADEVLTGLTINPTTINLFADEGLMQITVVNELPLPIEDLQMRVDPGNGRLRVLDQPEPITIGPESRATVQFRAKAVAAGQVPLHTSLTTPNGTQVGTAEATVVRVQPTGVWIYWLLGGVAGVILVLGLWRALRPTQPRRTSIASDSGAPQQEPGSTP